jgi:hypothetical protein
VGDEKSEEEMNLNAALREVREEFNDGAVVITSGYDRTLDEVISETDDEREVWAEWGEISYGGVTVPATHVFFLDEDGYMRRDGSGLSVVSARDYARLGR